MQTPTDEQEIRGLIDRWSQAVRDEDRAGIRADHDADILLFDVPLPLQSQGLDAYMSTWDLFFSHAERPVKFNFTAAAGASRMSIIHCPPSDVG